MGPEGGPVGAAKFYHLQAECGHTTTYRSPPDADQETEEDVEGETHGQIAKLITDPSVSLIVLYFTSCKSAK